MDEDGLPVEWWRAAAELAPDPVAFVHVDNTFAWVNQAWVRMVGYTPGELIGETWMKLTDAKDVGADMEEVAKVINGEQDCYYDFKFYRHKLTEDRIPVGIFVFRLPQSMCEKHEGYVVFARERASRTDLSDIRDEFAELKAAVEIFRRRDADFTEMRSSLTTIADCHACMKRSIDEAARDRKEIQATLNSVIAGGGKGVTIGGDYSGRDKTNTPQTVLLWLIAAIAVIGALAMGGRLLIEHGNSGSKVEAESAQ